MKVTRTLIAGTWLLSSFEFRFVDGSRSFPWGKAVSGQLI